MVGGATRAAGATDIIEIKSVDLDDCSATAPILTSLISCLGLVGVNSETATEHSSKIVACHFVSAQGLNVETEINTSTFKEGEFGEECITIFKEKCAEINAGNLAVFLPVGPSGRPSPDVKVMATAFQSAYVASGGTLPITVINLVEGSTLSCGHCSSFLMRAGILPPSS